MKRYVLGIDGGGTYTRAVIMDDTGMVCGTAQSGASNYDDIGVEATRRNIGKAVELTRNQAALSPEPFNAVFLDLEE